MIAYLDLSVLLRVVLRQSNALAQWPALERGIGSALVEVECLRTLDRLRLAEGLADEEIAIRREAIFRIVEAMDIVELTRPVLARAAQPLPTALRTLDAIHLPTALLWRERTGTDLVMATMTACSRLQPERAACGRSGSEEVGRARESEVMSMDFSCSLAIVWRVWQGFVNARVLRESGFLIRGERASNGTAAG